MATDKPTLTLHWLEKSRSQRVLWLIHELDIPNKANFKIEVYERGNDMLAKDDLRAIHPLGKSPVLDIQPADGSKKITLAESGTIMEYLAKHYNPKLIPTQWQEGKENQLAGETESYLRYIQLMQYAEGSLMSILVLGLVIMNMKDGPQTPVLARPLTRIIGGRVEAAFLNRNYKAHFEFMEEQLKTSPGGGKFFCGPEISCVDYMLVYPLGAALGRVPGVNEKNYPRVAGFVKMIEQRPGFKAAVQQIIDVTGSYNPDL